MRLRQPVYAGAIRLAHGIFIAEICGEKCTGFQLFNKILLARLAMVALISDYLDVPVAVMESAGEGGPWGMALLAAYMQQQAEGEALDSFLANRVFAQAQSQLVRPDAGDKAGFAKYMKRYTAGLAIQRTAVEHLE